MPTNPGPQTSITDTCPGLLERLGLLAALEGQVASFRAATALSIDCAIEIDADAHEPTGSAARVIIGMFGEMLSLVARDALARCVTIRVALTRAWLTIRVADDREGAPAASIQPASPRDFGGTLTVECAPGRPSWLCLSMPLS
jgi:signal transduction histidine kinase